MNSTRIDDSNQSREKFTSKQEAKLELHTRLLQSFAVAQQHQQEGQWNANRINDDCSDSKRDKGRPCGVVAFHLEIGFQVLLTIDVATHEEAQNGGRNIGEDLRARY